MPRLPTVSEHQSEKDMDTDKSAVPMAEVVIPMPNETSMEDKKSAFPPDQPRTPGATVDAVEPSSFPPIYLEWHDLTYSVEINKKTHEKKIILNKVQGVVRPGEVVAIMGSSGSGKSTLLNVLAGRVGAGEITGSILVNKERRQFSTWQSIIGYVEQDDLMFQNLTVRETITFAALLRLRSSMSLEQKMKRVSAVIAEMGLAKCEHTRIGDSEHRGISGGERKRVAIAVELVNQPRLLFLDEPTSGLDAFVAMNIIESVKNMAVQTQRTVLLTIHQPRENILSKFDRIILLSNGKIVFNGSVNHAVDHFEKCGFTCPPRTNPSDFFLDIMTVDYRTPELKEASMARAKTLQDAWTNMLPQETVSPPPQKHHSTINAMPSRKWSNPMWYEMILLLKRNLQEALRDKAVIGATIGQAVINCIILGFIFFQVSNDGSGVQNRLGVLFMMIIQLTFGNVMPQLAVLILQRQIIKRERAAGTYRAISAFISRVIASLPLTFAGTLLFAIPVYWMIGLNNDASLYFIFLTILTSHALIASFYGLFVSSGSPNVAVGQIIAPTTIVVFLIFGGQLVNLGTVPQALRWIQYFSIIRYSYAALTQNEFSGLTFTCQSNSVCYGNGDAVLGLFSLNQLPLWTNFGLAWLLGASFLVNGYILYEMRSRPLLRIE